MLLAPKNNSAGAINLSPRERARITGRLEHFWNTGLFQNAVCRVARLDVIIDWKTFARKSDFPKFHGRRALRGQTNIYSQ